MCQHLSLRDVGNVINNASFYEDKLVCFLPGLFNVINNDLVVSGPMEVALLQKMYKNKFPSLVMGQNLSFSGVGKFIRQARCSENKLVCFLPGMFSLSGSNLIVSSLMELQQLMKIFNLSLPSLSMLTTNPLSSGSPHRKRVTR